jgi:hypothetical protein
MVASAVSYRKLSFIFNLVSAEGMPSASNINGLNCQTDLKVHFDQQRVFPALSNLIVERDDGLFEIGFGDNAAGPFETRTFAAAVASRGGDPPDKRRRPRGAIRGRIINRLVRAIAIHTYPNPESLSSRVQGGGNQALAH